VAWGRSVASSRAPPDADAERGRLKTASEGGRNESQSREGAMQSNMRTCAWATSALSGVMLIGLGSLAQAQTSPTATPPAPAVAEVVVTAQKRSENVQTVPVAVSVVSASALQANGIFTPEGLEQVVPSLTFKKGTTNLNSTLSIRGIGTQSFASGAEPSVSTVVDGVVYGRSGMAFQEFTDLDHIEVLRGPQGTLFGKNANAGLINIVTVQPTAIQHSDISFGYFEGGEYRANVDLSGPITDTLGYTLSGVYGQYRGNIFNRYNDTWTDGYNHIGARGKLVWRPQSNVRFTLEADYTHAADNCCADVLGPYIPNAQFTQVFLPSIAPVTPGATNKEVDNDFAPRTNDGNGGVSGTLDYSFDGFTLTSVTAWRNWRNKQERDGDFHGSFGDYVAAAGPGYTAASMDLSEDDIGALNYNQYSEELRLASPTHQRLEYVVGGFLWYTDENDVFTRYDDECTASTLPVAASGFQPCAAGASTFLAINGPAAWRTKFYNEAMFGQATFNITDRLRAIGGLRYTFDRVTYALARGFNVAPPAGFAVPGISNPFAASGATDDNGPSAKAGLQYDFTSRIMGYATYSRGYKGPAFNVFYNQTAANTAPISPETSDSYEVGLKSEFLDRTLTVNLAAFDEKFYNFQANSFVIVNGSTTTSLTNAGAVRTEGVELETSWHPVRAFTLTGGYTYDDARIIAYHCGGLTGANLTTCTAHDGRQLPFAPRHKLDVTGDYRLPLPAALPFTTRLVSTYSYQSLTNFDIDQTPLARQPAYGLWDATLTFSTRDGRYRLSILGKNLTNQYYTTFITPGGNGVSPGSYTRFQVPRDAQRYVGAQVQANF
jgi:iron complex outermembrane receptor protein